MKKLTSRRFWAWIAATALFILAIIFKQGNVFAWQWVVITLVFISMSTVEKLAYKYFETKSNIVNTVTSSINVQGGTQPRG